MFRPCIDLHEGKVKQIVGGTLGDAGLRTNFVATQPAAWFAELYKRDGLTGGHVTQLGAGNQFRPAGGQGVAHGFRRREFSRAP